MKTNFIKSTLSIALTIVCLAFANHVSAQTTSTIVNYDFNTNPCTAAPAATATNVASTFTAGAGCVSAAGSAATSPPAFTANPTAGTAPSLTGTTAQFQFDLSGTALNTFSNYMLFFQTRSSGTGPNTISVQCSVNGGAFTTCATLANLQNSAFNNQTVDLSGVTTLNNANTLSFRIIGSGGASTGTFRIDNFQVQATAPSAPTASAVTVSGRALTATGRGIRGVIIRLTDGSGNVRWAYTSAFGYYRFADVNAGETFVVTAKGKRFEFSQPTQVLNVDKDKDDVNFIAY